MFPFVLLLMTALSTGAPQEEPGKRAVTFGPLGQFAVSHMRRGVLLQHCQCDTCVFPAVMPTVRLGLVALYVHR